MLCKAYSILLRIAVLYYKISIICRSKNERNVVVER